MTTSVTRRMDPTRFIRVVHTWLIPAAFSLLVAAFMIAATSRVSLGQCESHRTWVSADDVCLQCSDCNFSCIYCPTEEGATANCQAGYNGEVCCLQYVNGVLYDQCWSCNG